jgi:DNA-damage-inducible protein J
MSRSAIIQARVRPEIKLAGELVLRNIGLTMTEAMELFLRRLIVDQRMPFEVVAMDEATFSTVLDTWEAKKREDSIQLEPRNARRSQKRPKRE